MANITLARALKLKNRLAGRGGKLKADVAKYNSLPEGRRHEADAKALWEQYVKYTEALAELKAAIAKANHGQYDRLFLMEELRSRVDLLQSLSTTDGEEATPYREGTTKYVASLKREDVDGLVRGMQDRLDALQELVDAYNHNSNVDVKEEWLHM